MEKPRGRGETEAVERKLLLKREKHVLFNTKCQLGKSRAPLQLGDLKETPAAAQGHSSAQAAYLTEETIRFTGSLEQRDVPISPLHLSGRV